MTDAKPVFTEGIAGVHKHFGGKNVSPSDSVMSVQFTGDGNWAAAATSGGPVNFFNVSDPKTTAVFNPLGLAEDTMALTAFKIGTSVRTQNVKGAEVPSYLTASFTSTGKLQLHDVVPNAVGKCLAVAQEQDNEGLVASFSKDDQFIATGGIDKVIRLYDTQEGGLEKVAEFTQGIDRHGQDTLGHPSRIFAIKWVDEHTFLSGGWESSVLLFDTREKHAVRSFDGPHISGDGIDFFHNAVVTASERTSDQLQVFDFGTGKQIGKSITFDSMLYGVKAVERQGQLFGWVCGNKENAVHCVSLPSGKIVESYTNIEESVFAIDVSSKSNNIIFGGAHNAAYTASWIIKDDE